KNDDYVKANDPLAHTPARIGGGKALHVTQEQALETAIALEDLTWGDGLTRDQIRRKYRALPDGIYLRLPDSKRFTSATEVLHEAGVYQSRAEGDFIGAHPDLPTEESLGDGGPPDWGTQPAVYSQSASVQSGSATDEEGLLPGDNPEEGEVPGN
ncbi:MAG: hypothetical protein ACRDHE_08445, partial [Ktedonobacterales bacterium]